jgi:hypothetical protein
MRGRNRAQVSPPGMRYPTSLDRAYFASVPVTHTVTLSAICIRFGENLPLRLADREK